MSAEAGRPASHDDGHVLCDIDPRTVRRIHFVGVAGTGMGSFAGMLKTAGYTVTGSDQNVFPPMSEHFPTVTGKWRPANPRSHLLFNSFTVATILSSSPAAHFDGWP